MSIKSFRAFSILLITTSAAAQNAAYDSVSVGNSIGIQNQAMGLNGSRREISVYGDGWNDHSSTQCTAPRPDGAGNCKASCSDGSQISYVGDASCPAYIPPPAPPKPLDHSTTCTAPVADGNGHCVSSCTDGTQNSYDGYESCGGKLP